MKRYFAELISGILIVLFAYAAIMKMADMEQFKFSLRHIPLIKPGADMIAWMLPLTELFIVLLLFFERTRVWGLKASLIVLTAFTLFLAYMILFVRELPCSCGGLISSMNWQQHVVFNLFFVAINLFGLIKARQRSKQAVIE
jgi:hypothetical protein